MCQSVSAPRHRSSDQEATTTKSSETQEVPQPVDYYKQVEYSMISGVITILEFSVLLFATTKALFSIVNPKVQGIFYYVLVILPFSVLLPTIVGTNVQKAEKTVHDDWTFSAAKYDHKFTLPLLPYICL